MKLLLDFFKDSILEDKSKEIKLLYRKCAYESEEDFDDVLKSPFAQDILRVELRKIWEMALRERAFEKEYQRKYNVDLLKHMPLQDFESNTLINKLREESNLKSSTTERTIDKLRIKNLLTKPLPELVMNYAAHLNTAREAIMSDIKEYAKGNKEVSKLAKMLKSFSDERKD